MNPYFRVLFHSQSSFIPNSPLYIFYSDDTSIQWHIYYNCSISEMYSNMFKLGNRCGHWNCVFVPPKRALTELSLIYCIFGYIWQLAVSSEWFHSLIHLNWCFTSSKSFSPIALSSNLISNLHIGSDHQFLHWTILPYLILQNLI